MKIKNLKSENHIFQGPDGKLEAVNVTGPNGAEVIGSEYAPEKSNYDKSYWL